MTTPIRIPSQYPQTFTEKKEPCPNPLTSLSVHEKSTFQTFKSSKSNQTVKESLSSRTTSLAIQATKQLGYLYGSIAFFEKEPLQNLPCELSRVGQGGHGVVYKCRWEENIIAVKKFSKKQSAIREGLAIQSMIDCPDASRLLHTYRSGNHFCIALPFYPKTLDPSEKFSLINVIKIALDITKQLDHLHKQKWIHNDVKPPNICIGDGNAYLIDFSSAKNMKNPPEIPAQVGGTLDYMAPEKFLKKVTTPSSDLWSLGVILFELCTNRKFISIPTHHRGHLADLCLEQIFQRIGLPTDPRYKQILLQNDSFKKWKNASLDISQTLRAFRNDIPDSLVVLISRLLSYEKNRPSIQETLEVLTSLMNTLSGKEEIVSLPKDTYSPFPDEEELYSFCTDSID